MSVIIKSDKKATASLGNINGLRGAQDWRMFFDFENEIYQTKQNDTINSNYALTDVVEASRSNLSGQPISIAKDGTERKISTVTDLRTALLKNGRFGLLVEEFATNYFLNSAAPVTQTITLSASAVGIIVSCEGSGSVTVTGNVTESGAVITSTTPQILTRTSSSAACNITVTVSGSLSHVQVELFTGGPMTATSKITTTTASLIRNREFVKVKQTLFDSLITNKNGFTVLAQTIDYNTVVNQANQVSSKVGIEAGSNKMLAMSGINPAYNLFAYTHFFNGASATTSSKGVGAAANLNDLKLAQNNAMAFGGGKVSHAFNGITVPDLTITDPTTATNINFFSYDGGYSGLKSIVTKLVVFDRVLSAAELVDITKSWV